VVHINEGMNEKMVYYSIMNSSDAAPVVVRHYFVPLTLMLKRKFSDDNELSVCTRPRAA
jgi:hypothetical protein